MAERKAEHRAGRKRSRDGLNIGMQKSETEAGVSAILNSVF